MQKSKNIQLPEMKLVGIKARTNNKAEMNPATAKIGVTMQKYFQGVLPDKILYRKSPGTTLCIYTEYESDYMSEYTYFIGEAVTSFDHLPEGLERHLILPQTYTKFTTEPGRMPDVVIEAWQKIWQMDNSALGGKRNYRADFEIYDQRAQDHQNVIVDIYIGVES